MNKWSKIGFTVGMGATIATSTHFINKFIFTSSVSKNLLGRKPSKIYQWKFGDIAYYVKGSGAPLLLIHDLNSYSSSYEWSKIIDKLSLKNQVYIIDLLGCGQSDKPNITYTAYMYTQLLSDFIANVIKRKTSVVVTGKSVPMTIMSAFTQPQLFNKLILINPQNIQEAMQIPSKKNNIIRKLYNSPIFGTLLYNIKNNRNEIQTDFIENNFYNASIISNEFLEVYHESAHLKGYDAKYLYSSILCHYTTVSIAHALSQLDNSIYIIYGNKEQGIKETVEQYTTMNTAIEQSIIYNTKHLPQIERPNEIIKYLELFLGD